MQKTLSLILEKVVIQVDKQNVVQVVIDNVASGIVDDM